jgi:hypothetical protein
MSEDKTFKAQFSVKWIKSDSGNTYLCPADAFDRIDDRSESALARFCTDESENPQNN